MKKSKVIAGVCAAVLCCGMISVPGTAEANGTAVVSAASVLKAPTGVTTACSGNTLSVKWKAVSGASAYKIYVKYPWSDGYEVYKTVKTASVKIPDLVYGNKVSVKIVPLKKTTTGYSEGSAAKFTKTFSGKRAGISEGGLFLFDTSLIGKSKSYVSKALKKTPELEDWPWWTDNSGGALKVSFTKYNGLDLTLFFNTDNKLVEVYYDSPLDNYSDSLAVEADERYIKGTVYNDPDRDVFIAYTAAENVGFQLNDETYAETGEVVLRQSYFDLETMSD
ncbi:MAG: hypothetical protein SOU50_04560 [Oscillospiraceae bacterium]|nr:hypothetical protein [Oscillospiraceae bacterium]